MELKTDTLAALHCAATEARQEAERAVRLHGLGVNLHERYAVLLEEVCLYLVPQFVYQKNFVRTKNARREAVQIAAMALTIIAFCDGHERGSE